MSRPLGVTIMAILSLISGLLGVLKGLAFLGLGGLAAAGLTVAAHPIAGVMTGLVALIFGIIALATGTFALIFAWGAFGLRPWAWTMGVFTHGVILLWSVFAALGPGRFAGRWGTLLISGAVLYYLTRPEIKAAFGKN